MSLQVDPGGQSMVAVQVVMGCTRSFAQCRSPSTLGRSAHAPPPHASQSLLSVQAMAQLPLPRHTWPAGQAAHSTGWPQLLRLVPQRPAHVAPRDSGWQHVPREQTRPASQVPQEPPHPSVPQVRSAQFGLHTPFRVFLRRFRASASGAKRGPARPTARTPNTARRETPAILRASASKRSCSMSMPFLGYSNAATEIHGGAPAVGRCVGDDVVAAGKFDAPCGR